MIHKKGVNNAIQKGKIGMAFLAWSAVKALQMCAWEIP